MVAQRSLQGKRFALNGCRGESGRRGSDLESGRAGGERQREKRNGEKLADEIYSVDADEDFRAKLRITRLGEKPQLRPNAIPG